MKLKNIILASLLVGLAVSASAQPGGNRERQTTQPNQSRQLTTVVGTVAEWTYNDDFEFDGLLLNTGRENVIVKFRPHLAQQIKTLGNNLTVRGIFHTNRGGVEELRAESMSGNGQTVVAQSPNRNNARVRDPLVNGEGKVSQMQLCARNNIIGYILDNGIVLRLSIHSTQRLSQMVKVGTVIEYSGVEFTLRPGHVRAYDYKIVRCQTISIDGTQYMVR